MSRHLTLAYAGIAYGVAMLNLVYFVGFIADFGVPKSISSGNAAGGLLTCVLVDAALVAAFGALHSIMARRSFKRRWTLILPAPMERATYLYTTALTSVLLVLLWQPIPITLWKAEAVWAVALLAVAYLGVWSMMLAATFHFGHFDFLGLAQAWRYYRRRPNASPSFAGRYLYALVRHPISLGWMLTPWLVAHFTVGHLVFAVSTMTYILIATRFEEADLVAELGHDYRDYKTRVPAFLPAMRRAHRPGGGQ